jgi:hypothetical protein
MASEFNSGIGERNVALVENIGKPAKALSVSPPELFADFP